MSEEQKPSGAVNLVSKGIEAKYNINRLPNMPVFAADFATVMTDVGAQSCTINFIRRHPTMRYGDKQSVNIEGVEEEVFLEIKMPLSTAMGFSVYMAELLNKIRTEKIRGGIFFGPSSIQER